ncbi:hypothetical protein QRD43_19285 [Pelomonas sp. APW6]|uniref:SWIM-type domain-containing protein n=1 Tax=Roseateles subflavus TaxID=3053353 RepID=A0ABT7LMF8_9BURK|nr:hypothetical protein [Pelomonas sp. APW6]MDL5034051.1 hypothetical protein [Pelomonas sp. APW6]
MTSLRARLQEQLARYDDEGFAALANRGLLRRAQKDLERLTVHVSEDADTQVVVTVGEQHITFDERGPAKARCDCPASGVCQHILAAALGLRQLAEAGAGAAPSVPADRPATGPDAAPSAEPPQAGEPPVDPLAPLREALLAISPAALLRHAGKAGYRWAWQCVQDHDDTSWLRIGGSSHLVLTLQQPRLTLRYMGGGLEQLIADVALARIEKYQVAAVLAFQRAHGQALTPPEPAAAPRTQALDLGMDHALAATGAASLPVTRERLRLSARRLFADAVELGLSHLSAGMQERFTTLAVWAQGAEYPSLALLLRRLADHVELLLERAGGADEHRLLDELTLAHALVDALGAAAAQDLTPARLLGRARTRYDETGTLEVLGLGARPWRAASGYVGLTMLLWSPQEGFLSCTDARPESLRGFDPVARYHAPGPWTGLGAPQRATGQRLALLGAQLNEARRLSARESTHVTMLPPQAEAWSAEGLEPWTDWAALAASRQAGRSLLDRPGPMEEWAFLQPDRIGPCRFDDHRQTLLWPLWDAGGRELVAELPYDRFNAPALAHLEALPAGSVTDGLIVVAQVRSLGGRLRAEPLSLIRPGQAQPVSTLHFDAAPASPAAPGLLARWRQAWAARSETPRESGPPPVAVPGALLGARHTLQRLAERGLPSEVPDGWRAALQQLATETGVAGFTAFAALGPAARPGEALLRLNYIRLAYEALGGADADALE